ncbi:hypothetical protein C7I55_07895 [Sphingomonas deserti]|uniref:Uncharacterized protein n=1 Tax=Allosphingosinicella deserti TaxID=2116704 RepID=A0A2P7QW13_9SPHN|nr:hypothetical protein C7I55_07895 [Sphingomonas deserti]
MVAKFLESICREFTYGFSRFCLPQHVPRRSIFVPLVPFEAHFTSRPTLIVIPGVFSGVGDCFAHRLLRYVIIEIRQEEVGREFFFALSSLNCEGVLYPVAEALGGYAYIDSRIR